MPRDPLREAIEKLAAQFDRRANSPLLHRVTKRATLEKCASDLRAALASAPPPKPHLFDKRAADALAREVQRLIERKVIDSRSPAADALLDYLDPGPNESVRGKLAASAPEEPTPDERRLAFEEVLREVNAVKQSAALAQERARAAGRDRVADCRDSDVETCERIEKAIERLAGAAAPSSPPRTSSSDPATWPQTALAGAAPSSPGSAVPTVTREQLQAALAEGAERATKTAEILRRVEAGGRVSIEDMRHVLGDRANAKLVPSSPGSAPRGILDVFEAVADRSMTPEQGANVLSAGHTTGKGERHGE